MGKTLLERGKDILLAVLRAKVQGKK